jgi:hypothetical protein
MGPFNQHNRQKEGRSLFASDVYEGPVGSWGLCVCCEPLAVNRGGQLKF